MVPESAPLWLRNRNQRVHMGGLMREGAYIMGGGEIYTWSNTSAKEKVGLSAGGLYAAGGRLIGGEKP